ncbi:MAG: hypothetical protein WCR21_03245 [Bacteroidota bacterium]
MILSAVIIYFFNGTGDVGDSIAHYLFAKWAPYHHELYFDHWAKPVFVLLASPFAQFGFVGMKFFNVIINLCTILLTYKLAEHLGLKNSKLILLILLFSPLYYILTFSGLTEPLFALFVALGLYFVHLKKNFTAFTIISFLPYVRSEGLIIIGVFALYGIYQSHWKYLPFLLLGSFVYGIAGYFVYHDVLWVFTKIPYAKLSSVYGNGTLFHFVDKLVNVCGVPIYGMFWIGFLVMIYHSFKSKSNAYTTVLIWFGFVAFFTAHSLFWYLGIFNSMGLQRVLICMMPMLAIMALYGFNFLTEHLLLSNHKQKFYIQAILVVYIVVFPFTANPSAINWNKDMRLTQEQRSLIEMAKCLNAKQIHAAPILYNHHYISEVLNIDHFDERQHLKITKESVNQMKSGDVLIWDNKFCPIETEINCDSILAGQNFTVVCSKSVLDLNAKFEWMLIQRR